LVETYEGLSFSSRVAAPRELEVKDSFTQTAIAYLAIAYQALLGSVTLAVHPSACSFLITLTT
jgi:hypothetical protein